MGDLIPAIGADVEPARDETFVELVRAYVSTLMWLPTNGEEADVHNEDLLTLDAEMDRYQQELRIAHKVDGFAYMLAWLEKQSAFMEGEAARLTRRAKVATATIERLKRIAAMALAMVPKPKHGPRELVGNAHTLALYQNPPRVSVLSEALVPTDYKNVTVSMPLAVWQEVALQPNVLGKAKLVKTETLKTLVKLALDAGKDVPGAEVVADFRVVRK